MDNENQQLQTVAALCYLFTPLVPLIALFGTENATPELQRHARQALWWAIPFLLMLIIVIILMVQAVSASFLMICLLPFAILIPFVPGAIWARRVYLGGDVSIPIINRFVR